MVLVSLACGEYPGVPRGLTGGEEAGLLPASSSAGSESNAGVGEIVAGREVRIELEDFELVPSDITVSSGEITFTLVNSGRYTHDYRIEGEGVDEKSPRIAAGRDYEWVITLAPGEYTISCPISNHADRGMVGTLTVTP